MRARQSEGLAAEAYLTVRDRILRGELKIGQPISRRRLAAELGMSFLPVSEALLRLENEGLVESRPRAGTRVSLPSQEDIRGHYVVREAVEVKAAMLFCEVATPSERGELIRLAARVDALSASPEPSRQIYLNLHQELHWRIAERTRCKPLCDALERASALASTWMSAAKVATPDEPPDTHHELLRILAGNDPNAAGEAMRAHIQSGMQKTLHRLAPYFEMRDQNVGTFSRMPKRQRVETVVPPAAEAKAS